MLVALVRVGGKRRIQRLDHLQRQVIVALFEFTIADVADLVSTRHDSGSLSGIHQLAESTYVESLSNHVTHFSTTPLFDLNILAADKFFGCLLIFFAGDFLDDTGAHDDIDFWHLTLQFTF